VGPLLNCILDIQIQINTAFFYFNLIVMRSTLIKSTSALYIFSAMNLSIEKTYWYWSKGINSVF